ncbi:hypothetical protein SLEP1_g13978 [Rubroshorea leprosula]|uniref:Agenet domain-containing protein n=1 Tax=Rubroshorea leprosula TaxID=152421 RepID=A0AAV5INJ1_9ROSI|nr:hypothetical protein SLEP1_g13978 [Rubroshorea leprosula]
MPRKPKPKPKSKPTIPPIPPHLKAGKQVEISSDDPGYRGSWYAGTVIRRVSSKDPNKFVVQYTSLFKDEEGKKPLREVLDAVNLRPPAPKEKARKFRFSEKVDAFYNDGWWEGVITEDLGKGRFLVYFRPTKEQIEFGEKELRLHREWVDGVWKPPLEEEDDNTSKGMTSDKGLAEEIKLDSNQSMSEKKLESNNLLTEEKLKSNNSRTGEKFSEGMRVEVRSDEDGFKGAWFAATIVEALGRDKYIIQYESLRTEDDKDFLKEEADAVQIRPYPPETVVDHYKLLEEVDALYNDGWWVGVISKVLPNSRYKVYFQTTSEELVFDHSQLRLHQDWIDGKWVVASQALKL